MKFPTEVKRNLRDVTIGTIVLTIVMLLAYAIVKQLTVGVVLGALISAVLAVLNFFLLTRTIVKASEQAASHQEVKKTQAQLGYMLRTFLIMAVAIISIAWLKTDALATLLPLLFPRITIGVLQLIGYYKKDGGEA